MRALPLPPSLRCGILRSKLQMSLLALPAPPPALDISLGARGKEQSKSEAANFKENRKGLPSKAALGAALTRGRAGAAHHFHGEKSWDGG